MESDQLKRGVAEAYGDRTRRPEILGTIGLKTEPLTEGGKPLTCYFMVLLSYSWSAVPPLARVCPPDTLQLACRDEFAGLHISFGGAASVSFTRRLFRCDQWWS